MLRDWPALCLGRPVREQRDRRSDEVHHPRLLGAGLDRWTGRHLPPPVY
jgi:hypothetical protein